MIETKHESRYNHTDLLYPIEEVFLWRRFPTGYICTNFVCPNMALGYLIAGRYVDVRVILGRENLYAFVLNTTAASALRQKGAETGG